MTPSPAGPPSASAGRRCSACRSSSPREPARGRPAQVRHLPPPVGRARPARDVRPQAGRPGQRPRRGTRPTKTKVPGVIFGERMPKLAAMADKFAVDPLHAQHTDEEPQLGRVLQPHRRRPADRRPAAARLARTVPGLRQHRRQARPRPPKGVATFVAFPHVIADGSITPGQHASFLGKAHNPLFVDRGPEQARLPAARTDACRTASAPSGWRAARTSSSSSTSSPTCSRSRSSPRGWTRSTRRRWRCSPRRGSRRRST